MTPKWQRARLLQLSDEGNFKSGCAAGQLVWVKAGPPETVYGRVPGCGDQPTHRQAFMCSDGDAVEFGCVELLAEFSSADNPDAEARQ